MQNILGDAMANYNHDRVNWCYTYMAKMRENVLNKFDAISAHTLEYIENHTKIPPEEMEKLKNTIGGRKNESNIRQEFFIVNTTRDFRLGIYGNVAGKAQLHKYVEFGGVACKTPRQYGSQQLIIRAIWTSYDDVTVRTGTYYPDIVVGGVVDFRLYQYAEGSRQAMKWTVRNVFSIDDRLKNIPYPDPSSQIQPDPITIQFILPEYVFVTENDDIKVGVWDEKEKVWSTQEIDDLQLDKSTRKLDFTTRKLAQMAFLQSRCTDYPYKRWKLRCIENQKAVLDIETKRGILLNFEIGPEYLMLTVDANSEGEQIEGIEVFPELKHLKNQKFSPGYLLLELSKCGIHLLPRDEDAQLGEIRLKEFGAEERAIQDLSTAVRSFAFRSCRWNQSIEPDNIVLKVRENLEFDREFFEDHEPDWRYLMWWPNKCSFVRCSDLDETPDVRISQGHETHAILSLALQNGHVSAEAFERSQQYSYIDFIDTLKKTLRLTRVLSFT